MEEPWISPEDLGEASPPFACDELVLRLSVISPEQVGDVGERAVLSLLSGVVRATSYVRETEVIGGQLDSCFFPCFRLSLGWEWKNPLETPGNQRA